MIKISEKSLTMCFFSADDLSKCPHMIVDVTTIERTTSFLETNSALLSNTGYYYFVLGSTSVEEAPYQSNILFHHPFFEKVH